MSTQPTLAYTVHHKGRKYSGGTTAEDIGEVAGEFGDHVWVGGKAPAKSTTQKSSSGESGSRLGSPPVPPPSGLPGGSDAVVDVDSAAKKTTTPTGRRAGPGPGA